MEVLLLNLKAQIKVNISLLGGDQISARNPTTGAAIADLVALDTTTWTWVYPNIPGLPAVPYIYSSLTLFENTKLITTIGILLLIICYV